MFIVVCCYLFRRREEMRTTDSGWHDTRMHSGAKGARGDVQVCRHGCERVPDALHRVADRCSSLRCVAVPSIAARCAASLAQHPLRSTLLRSAAQLIKHTITNNEVYV